MKPVSLAARLLIAALCCSPLPVLAQSDADGASVAATAGLPSAAGRMAPGWRNQWGVGMIVNPRAVGGDDYNTSVIPYLDFRYFDEKGSLFFANVPQGIGGYAYRSRDLQTGRFLNIGGAMAPGFNVRDDSIPGLREIGVAAEARLLVEAGGRNWTLNAQLAQDVGSAHEGAYLDLSVLWRDRLGDASGFYAVGPVVRVGDSTYKNALFGVTEAEAIDSGFAPYEASFGVERTGIQGLVSLPIRNSAWRFTTLARFSRLLGDAADSPIVVDDNQYFFIASLTRAF